MNPKLPPNPRAELEAHVTAFLLGELPAHEAAALRQQMDGDAQLAELCEQLKPAIKLLRESAANPETPSAETAPLKLSDERRQKLLAHFKTIAPKEFVPAPKRRISWVIPLAACAVLLAVIAGLTLPKFGSSSKEEFAILRAYKPHDQRFARAYSDATTNANSTSEENRPSIESQAAAPLAAAAQLSNFLYTQTQARGAGAQVPQFGNGNAVSAPPAAIRSDLLDTATLPAAKSSAYPVSIGGQVAANANVATDAEKTRLNGKAQAEAAKNLADSSTTIVLPPANQLADASTPVTDYKQLGVGFSAEQPAANGGAGGGGAGALQGVGGLNNNSFQQQKIPLQYANAANVQDSLNTLNQSQSEILARGFGLDPVTGLPITPAPSANIGNIGSVTHGFPDEHPTGNRNGVSAFNSPGQSPVAGNSTIARYVPNQAVSGNLSTEAANQNGQSLNFNYVTPQAPAPVAAPPSLSASAPQPNSMVTASPAAAGIPPIAADSRDQFYARTPVIAESGHVPTKDELAEAELNQTANKFGAEFKKLQEGKPSTLGAFAPVDASGGTTVAKDSENRIPVAGTVAGGVYLGDAAKDNPSVVLTPPPTDSAAAPLLSDMPMLGALPASRSRALRSPHDSEGLTSRDVGSLMHPQNPKPLPGESLALKAPQETPVPSVAGTYFGGIDGWVANATNTIVLPQNNNSPQLQLAQSQQGNLWNFSDNQKPFQNEPVQKDALQREAGGTNIYSLGVVGYVNIATNQGFYNLQSTPLEPTPPQPSAGLPPAAPLEDRSKALVQNQNSNDPSRGFGDTLNRSVSSASVSSDVDVRLQGVTTLAPGSKQLFQLADKNPNAAQLAYFDKQRELDKLKQSRDALSLQTFQVGVEDKMPKTTMVEILEHAEANDVEKPSLLSKIGKAFTGEVERRARIKAGGDTTGVVGISGQTRDAGAYNPNVAQTELEVIQSDQVLDRVIERLNLNKVWAEKRGVGEKLTTVEARQMLKKKLDLSITPNTSLINIGVKSDSPAEAAQIANAIAEDYQDYRMGQRKKLILGGIQVYEKQLAQQDAEIARATQELDVLRRQSQVPQEDVAPAKPAAPAPEPQPEALTSENAFSTFSLNVSDVSFKLAAATLEKGILPEPASIRSEEFLNAFDYRDPAPAPGAPIGFTWERAQDPFAQNRDLIRFSVKTAAAGREPGRPLNIVLLLDNSGSMERADRVQIIREALRVLASELQPQDKLSVVIFARTASLWVDGVSGYQAGAVADAVGQLTPQGGTNLEEAMRLAYETARRHYLANGVNRVVLLTDGAANLGNVDPAALQSRVEENRKQGIALDGFGIGWEGYNDDLLEVLTRHGDGRYGFLNTPQEAATDFAGQLAGALHVAAADVKVQVEFNPARATAYRQIGYAKHQLTKEQFRDNTVAAAQIGAAESGNGLYVVAVNPAGSGPLGVVRVRFKVPGTSEVQEHAWELSYTGNAVPLDQANPAMRLAATASGFAEWLSQIPFAAEITPDELLHLLNGVPQVYGADTRPQKLEWMIRQAKSLSGK